MAMANCPPRILVAALRGGSGKTTLTLGLIRALRQKGFGVAPFKKGPDYIDPFWHSEAAGQPCRNLDPYLMGPDQTRRSFAHFSAGRDAALIEGNRGLFDGMDAAGSYSSAELAKLLAAPVVVVLDCTMTSRTVAAVALGCQRFDPDLNLAGVILNPVANARQEALARACIQDATGLPVLGAIPRLKLAMPERHMGLVPPQEHSRVAEALDRVGHSVAAHVDIDALWTLMNTAPAWSEARPPLGLEPEADWPAGPPCRVGVIRDAAFGFYYPENLEALERHGAELVFCSALTDQTLPEMDALYIGGGFPETHAARLAENAAFRADLLAVGGRGLPIYAECGGMMYLGGHIEHQGRRLPMVGLLPLDFVMQAKPQGHGYTVCQVVAPNPFFPVGLELRAHEFHYSRPVPHPGAKLDFAYRVERGQGILGDGGGIMVGNTLGTYHHVHVLGLTNWARSLVGAARRYRGGQSGNCS